MAVDVHEPAARGKKVHRHHNPGESAEIGEEPRATESVRLHFGELSSLLAPHRARRVTKICKLLLCLVGSQQC
jgi:hypothetical protein